MTTQSINRLTRCVAPWVMGPLMAAAAALWARHAWVQAQGIGAWCEQHASDFPCPWRELVIQAFIDHRLSTAALVLAALAWSGVLMLRLSHVSKPATLQYAASASRVCAWLGLVVSVCGLALYDADRSAFAALCCVLAASNAALPDDSTAVAGAR